MNPDCQVNYVSRFKIVDTRYLMFRGVGDLIKKYVKGSRALDYGCGPAQSTLFLKALELDVDGMDISEHAIEVAKQEDPAGNYVQIKSGNIPTDDCFYDLVFASIVFGHINSKHELIDIFKEIARVLKVGGTLIIIEFSQESYQQRDYISFHTKFDENSNLTSGCNVKIQFKDNVRVGNHYFFTDEDYINYISEAGFTVTETQKPLGKDSDGYEWLDEKFVSPCTIYVAHKV